MPINTNLQQLAFTQKAQERKAQLIAALIVDQSDSIGDDARHGSDRALREAAKEFNEDWNAFGDLYSTRNDAMPEEQDKALLEELRQIARSKVMMIELAIRLAELGVSSNAAQVAVEQLQAQSAENPQRSIRRQSR